MKVSKLMWARKRCICRNSHGGRETGDFVMQRVDIGTGDMTVPVECTFSMTIILVVSTSFNVLF